MANIAGPVGTKELRSYVNVTSDRNGTSHHFQTRQPSISLRICVLTDLPSPTPTTGLAQSQTTYKQVADSRR
jgi:hypothetical protein